MRALAVAACLLLAGCAAAPTGAGPADPSVAAPASASTPSTPGGSAKSPATIKPQPTTKPTNKATNKATNKPGTKPTEVRERPAGTKIIVADSPFGAMLYDASGQAIYLFGVEKSMRPECYGDCAEAWPPVLTEGDPRGSGKVRQALLGTTARRDGSRQVTYGGHPLYFYANEGKYEVLCHDVVSFDGSWFVVQPDGEAAPA